THDGVVGGAELSRGRGKKGKPRPYMNDGLLALLWRIVDSFREKARCSDGDDHRAAIERSADDLIAINLQDAGIVFNPGFLLCVCHGDALLFCFPCTLVDVLWFE